MEEKKIEFERAKALLDQAYEIAKKEGFGFGAGILSDEIGIISTFAVSMNVERWGHVLIESLPNNEYKELLGKYLICYEKEE